ncbi:MAG TPA: hypothetical protein VLA23_10090, partial [Candidatus Limnocylindrales bacterium]|nr:hypothetical protein [Candidatus Limnocylindrales bacterium]
MPRILVLVGLWAVAVGVAMLDLLVGLLARRGGVSFEGTAWMPALQAGFATVGLLILVNRPRNVIGGLCLAIGLVLAGSAAMAVYATLDDVRAGPATAAGSTAAMLSTALRGLAIALCGPLLARFPTGHLLSRRWMVVDALVLFFVATVAIETLRPHRVELAWVLPFENPIGIIELPGTDWDALLAAGGLAMFAVFIIAGAAIVLRYRRGRPTERAQIRWVAAAYLVAIGAIGAALVAPRPVSDLAWLVVTLVPGLFPIAIGIAVLRYRLYEIDRLISRTIGWAIVTGVLVGTFALLILGLQAVVEPLTGGNTLAIAGSTLVVAALFNPVRTRVQRAVDRRFDRSRYDGERLLAAFGERLRDEVDLTTISADVLATVDAAVRP